MGAARSNAGRPKLPIRLMASLLYLKHSFDLSDEELVVRWSENVLWQFFSGMDYFEHRLPCDATQIGRFRRDLGEEGLELLLKATTAPADVLKINLQPTQSVDSPLFKAISERQCTRGEFDGQPVSAEDLRLLTLAGTGKGVQLLLFTEKTALEKILEYVVQGNTAQMNDAAFVAELKTWIRFSDAEAVRAGDGLFSRSSGNPSVPRWLASPLFPLLFRTDSENDKYAKHVRSSSGIAIFVSDANDKAHWIETGRCYERFALQAAALGIRNAFLNQPVEVGALRPQFASFLGVGQRRPDLLVRFGRGPLMPRSLRRPVDTVLA